MRSPFEDAVRAAVASGVEALLQTQDRDGFWREFDLQPGASEGWTTAWVGWCLARADAKDVSRQHRIREACARAARALHRPDQRGWGFNRRTGPDADTTSWVLRFLAAAGQPVNPAAYLAPYVDAGGGVHTFSEPEFGAWTDAHDDVAANAGLALLTAPGSQRLVERIRRRLANRFPVDTYWWSTPLYGIAWTLRFMQAGGGVPPEIGARARRCLSELPASDSPFEIAHRLMSVAAVDGCPCDGVALVNQLLDVAGPHGWPGGSFLLVPPRAGGSDAPPHPEQRGLLTTSLSVRVLSEWLSGAGLARVGAIAR